MTSNHPFCHTPVGKPCWGNILTIGHSSTDPPEALSRRYDMTQPGLEPLTTLDQGNFRIKGGKN